MSEIVWETYDVLAPRWLVGDLPDGTELGRRLFRWTVYRTTCRTDSVAYQRVSEHWTRRRAWLASSKLRFGGNHDS